MDTSKIDPWINPSPSNADTMALNKLRQKVKKKTPWAYREMAIRYTNNNNKNRLKKASITSKKE